MSLAFEAIKTAFLILYELLPGANLLNIRSFIKPEDQKNAEFVEFYSHLVICAPITTGSNSSYEFSSHTASRGQPCNDGDIRLISAATYWEVTCSVPQTKIVGSIPRKLQYCNIVLDKTVCIKCTVGQAESITDRQHMAFTQLFK